MGFFSNQLANVVEWTETGDQVIFWKWNNSEIKKGSRLIIRQGQDAIFMYQGKIEGIFRDEGAFDIESQIIPFLSTLKGFKFGFNSGIRAEVLFINTKEFTVKWGTKNAINLPCAGLPGGMPIRAFGVFNFKVGDYLTFIDKIAGVKKQYTVDEVKERVLAVVDSLLAKWIIKEGKDMFNIQANGYDIGRGIASDLDMELTKIGIHVTGFVIQSVSYPESVKQMQEKAASQSMVGDMGRYAQMAMLDSLGKPGSTANSSVQMASAMASMQMGMAMGQQMTQQMGNMAASVNQTMNSMNFGTTEGQAQGNAQTGPKFCPNCGTRVNGARFCSNCGQKLI